MTRRAPEPLPPRPPPGGDLFSAVPFADTDLGRAWARIRPEALARFPELKLKEVEDLHLTVVYFGRAWDPAGLELLRPLAAWPPGEDVRFAPRLARFGRNGQDVVVELDGLPPALGARILEAKARLVASGLKRAEPRDGTFRPHVTLCAAPHRMTPALADRLQAFQDWAGTALDLDGMRLAVAGSAPTRLLLAGLPRDPGAPAYLPVEAFLARKASRTGVRRD
jgi:2'-5' RNA ligase